MTRTYEVVGVYPLTRPLPLGTRVELTDEQARYHRLDGTLKPIETQDEDAVTVATVATPRSRKRRRR